MTGFECQYDSVCSFTGPKQAWCGGPVVSTSDWHFQGFRSSSLFEGGGGGGRRGLYFYICLNPLEISIVVCVHGGICPASISIFSSFFQEIIHDESFSFFREVKLESQSFSVIAKLDPIR